MRARMLVVLVAGCCAATAGDAQAAGVALLDAPLAGLQAGSITYEATTVVTGHELTVRLEPGRRLNFTAPGIQLVSLTPRCTGGDGVAVCDVTDIPRAAIKLGPGPDRLTTVAPAAGFMEFHVKAGGGDDTITGSQVRDQIEAGPGDDVVDSGTFEYDEVHGGDGDDTLRAGRGLLHGEGGDDTLSVTGGELSVLSGGPGFDRLTGGPSADHLAGGDDEDVLAGNGGGDVLQPGFGTDTVDGGDGIDLLDYTDRIHAVTVTLDGVADEGHPQENDALTSIENVTGSVDFEFKSSPGDDISGDDGPNVLESLNAPATLRGLGGDDVLRLLDAGLVEAGDGDDTVVVDEYVSGRAVVDLGPGDDTLTAVTNRTARDGQPEDVVCGDGVDEVVVDHEDAVAPDCEVVQRR